MPSFSSAVLATGLAAAVAGAASASFSATYLGAGVGRFQKVSYNSTLSWNQSGSDPFYYVRAYDHHWQEDTGAQYTSWCIQLYQGIVVGDTYSFECVAPENAPQAPPEPGPMGTIKANLMRDLFARWGDVASGSVQPGANPSDTEAKAAAFALLIWEISHENFTGLDANAFKSEMSLATGAFRADATTDVSNWASVMLSSLGTGGWMTSDLQGLISDTAQDQIRLVPAPGVLALLGVAGIVGRRRRA